MKYIRYIVLISSICIAGVVYIVWNILLPQASLLTIRITETYALLALAYLYLALLPGALYSTFRSLPFSKLYFKARRAIGVSVFLFAILHACFAFFGLLGGFAGLQFLSDKYILAISMSFIALIILALLAATSLDVAVRVLGKRWKLLHRFIYIAGILILIHAFMLGSHFSDLSNSIPTLFLGATFFLVILEALRADRFFQSKFLHAPRFGLVFTGIAVIVGIVLFSVFTPKNISQPFNIHAEHRLLAQQAIQNSQVITSTNPALSGDKTKRYTVSFNNPVNVSEHQDTNLQFTVYDAGTGNHTLLFKPLYAKAMHCIIVSQDLTYFSHIHPIQQSDSFFVTTQFPKEGIYHIYVNFQPYGAIEQQFGFTLHVGSSDLSDTTVHSALQKIPVLKQTKVFHEYEVTMDTHSSLDATNMSLGNDTLTFILRDAKTHKPVTTLKPYLAAFGHVSMINERTYEFIHVHPSNFIAPPPNATSGPTVDFIPIGIYGPFKPGIYKVFAEFNPDGNLFVADFEVKVD